MEEAANHDNKNLGFLGAAERVLAESGEPLHYGDLTQPALASGWLETTSWG